MTKELDKIIDYNSTKLVFEKKFSHDLIDSTFQGYKTIYGKLAKIFEDENTTNKWYLIDYNFLVYAYTHNFPFEEDD